jgi:alanyl-tRNA synthetase
MEPFETNMASERSYYQDAYAVAFDAVVIERTRLHGQPAVVLDHTYFYFTSGGQPHDTGLIDGVRVVDVILREEDQAILHLLDGETESDRVHCKIDWARRFDHMQQHTGQHILSAAFEHLQDADTVGFHLGADSSTIDLNLDRLSLDQVAAAEEMANEVVFSDRPIEAAIMSPAETANLPLRKRPTVSGPVRIVIIKDFDLCACGGTHVKHAGEIGLIKITRVESRGPQLRLEFLCGRRALADYREKNALVTRVANAFTTGYREIEDAIDRLHDENRILRSNLRKAQARLLDYEAEDLYNTAVTGDNMRIITAAFSDRDRSDLSWLAKNLAERPGVVALLGLAGTKCHLLFARAHDVDHDMVPLLKSALSVLGSTSGGGRPEIAQGGGPAADQAAVSRALHAARQLLLAES